MVRLMPEVEEAVVRVLAGPQRRGWVLIPDQPEDLQEALAPLSALDQAATAQRAVSRP